MHGYPHSAVKETAQVLLDQKLCLMCQLDLT